MEAQDGRDSRREMTREQRISQEAREVLARAVQMMEVATSTMHAIRALLSEVDALRTRLPR